MVIVRINRAEGPNVDHAAYIVETTYKTVYDTILHTDGLVQDCSNSIANAMELLQSCTKPST